MSLRNHFVGEEVDSGGGSPAENERSGVGGDFFFVEVDGQVPGGGAAASGSGSPVPSAAEGAVESEEAGAPSPSRADLSATETLSSAFTDVPHHETAPMSPPQPVQALPATSPPCRAASQLPLSREALERIGTIALGLGLIASVVLLVAIIVSCIVPVCLDLSAALALGLADLSAALALGLTDLYDDITLHRELNAVPAEYFAPAQRSLVRAMAPKHQFLVFGLHGAGKSTTLQNLAIHAWLAPHEARQFSVSRGGGESFTQEVKKARFGEGVTMFDTKGLTNWDLEHIDALENLVSGKTKVGCPMRWDLPVYVYEEVEEKFRDCDGCYLWCRTRTRTTQALVERPRANRTSVFDCDSKLEEPARGGAVHAALLIVRYPSEEEYQSINAEAKQFLLAMRDRMPQLFPVMAVTHLDECMRGGRSAQACSDALAEDMGFTELGSVFPLDAAPNLDPRIQADKSIKASQLTPIIRALRYKAFEFYKRRLPQDEDL